MRPSPFVALVAALAASYVCAAPSDARLEKRIFDGDSKFVFECNQQIIPDPVSGGGNAYFSQALYFEYDGKKYHPKKEDCTSDPKDATCKHCLVNAPALDSPTMVRACYLPPAGKKSCTIDYYYGNRHYNSNLDKDFCEKIVDATISNARITSICYFNHKLYHEPTTTRSIPPWTPTPVPDPVELGPNPKVLIVGDSITHGQEGDHTWRYRIYEWFKNYAPNTKPEFVGPYTGTQERDQPREPQPPPVPSRDLPPNTSPRTSGGYYRDMPSFQSNHFAVWGRQIAQDIPLIHDVVRKYKPDILLVLLGFNDMGWFVSDAEGTLMSMEKFIREARKVNPGLRLAIANVPQRSLIPGREDLPVKTTAYNRALPALLKKFDSPLGPARLVDVAGNYDCAPQHCPAGYDGLHPNAYGEYLIAQAFSRTLHNDFGVGKGQLQLLGSFTPRPLPVPSNIRAVPAPMGVKITWDQVYESNSYDVRSRIAGSFDWTETRAGTNRHDHTWTVKGVKWEFQIRSGYGEPSQGGAKGPWSGVISVTADRSTPPPPKDIRTSSSGNSLTVSWGAVDGGSVDRFGVIIWDRDTPGAFIDTRGSLKSPLSIDGLTSGHRYDIWVATWGGPGRGGLPAEGNPVKIGGGTPSTPSGVKAETVDPTTARITWNAVNGAAAYRVYRIPDEAAKKIGSKANTEGELIKDGTQWGEAFLVPGTWHFTYCVAAVNGQQQSSRACATPPKADGF